MRRSFQGSVAGESRFGSSVTGRERGVRPRPPLSWWVVLGGLVLLSAGCSGSGGQEVALVSPSEAASQAMTDYDANKDGALDAKELEACPGLLSALKRADKNTDGRLSADEIAERLTYFQNPGMQLDVGVVVTLDGRPLSGATVKLVPEKLMGPTTQAASAVTDQDGGGTFMTEGDTGEPVAPGYYRVEVSKTVNGREVVPAKYNAQTVLGQEIVPDAGGRGSSLTVRLRLTSR